MRRAFLLLWCILLVTVSVQRCSGSALHSSITKSAGLDSSMGPDDVVIGDELIKPADDVVIGDELLKPACDKLGYRFLHLPSGLKVLLISDPDTDKAAAALDVSLRLHTITTDSSSSSSTVRGQTTRALHAF